ncbi:MAG: hypothetical protein JWQ35_1422 [Bacteriovoracaceae bacterium]|nr:hypothetical protein [Bacteriovoracaceae bacterium]
MVITACPFAALPKVLQRLSSFKITALVNASKGIDQKSLMTFTRMTKKYLKVPTATLSGPTFAKEVLEKKPTACVLAGESASFVRDLAKKLSTNYFRIYVSSDPIGVEACGAMKNVLAIACGISDGLRLGQNARAALLTRGLIELRSIVEKLGGRAETVFGLAGVGDLWLTATGDLSRNRRLGLALAEGLSVKSALKKINGTCEGLYTAKQIYTLAKNHRMDLPISEQVYSICFKGKDPKTALFELMNRELKSEESSSSKGRRT